jgi:fructose-specific phosphotransferase system IIA component
MKISEYLEEKFCVMELKSKTKEDAIKELANTLAVSKKVKNVKQFLNDIISREGLGSTGIGHGLAIPHSRTDTVDEFVIAYGRSKAGIDFNALDGQKVNMVFLMGASTAELNLYLRLLAELSKCLMKDSFRQELLNAATPREIIDAFKKSETA